MREAAGGEGGSLPVARIRCRLEQARVKDYSGDSSSVIGVGKG